MYSAFYGPFLLPTMYTHNVVTIIAILSYFIMHACSTSGYHILPFIACSILYQCFHALTTQPLLLSTSHITVPIKDSQPIHHV